MFTTPATTRTHAGRIALLIGIALTLAVGVGAAAETGAIAVSNGTATTDDGAEVDLSMAEAPNGLQRYNVTVHLENPDVATIESASAGDIEEFQVRSTTEDSITFRAADLSESVQPGATDVALGTVTLEGSNAGSSELTVTVQDFRTDGGEQSDPTVSGGSFTVQKGTGASDGEQSGSLGDLASSLPGPPLAWAAGIGALATLVLVAIVRRL